MEKRFEFINKIWEGILWIIWGILTAEFSIWGETKDFEFLTNSLDVRAAGFWGKKSK